MTNTKNDSVLLKVEHLQKYFPIKKSSIFQKEQKYVKANKDISINIHKGETLGLVGESGCGKSTFGRTLIQLYNQTGGVTLYYGVTVDEMMPSYVNNVYRSIPSVFKDYDADKQKLDELFQQLLKATDGEYDPLNEQHRLSKIEFENKYGNILRLAGGLLVSSDLNAVSKLLQEKYTVGSRFADAKIEFEKEKTIAEMGGKENSEKLASAEKKMSEYQKDLDTVNAKIQAEKDTLKSNPRFDEFENELDNGLDLSALTKREIRSLRKDLQIIFQDPYSSLDPRLTVGNIIGEGLIAHGLFKSPKSEGYVEYIQDIMEKCGLDKSFIHRYPHQFSGGQRQRIGIARALALQPDFIVCDEAVSALDVSIQSQVINLLQDLKDENELTYLFITHDLGVVRYISDRIGVMYFGNLVELASAEEIFSNPQHPYTKQLLAAIPRMEKDQAEIEKLLAKSTNPNFDFTFEETGEADKDWYEVSPNHFVACRLNPEVLREAN